MKIIKLEDKTHKELMQMGTKGQTFDEIVKSLIEFKRKEK